MPVMMQPEAVELALRSASRESDTSLDFVFVCVCVCVCVKPCHLLGMVLVSVCVHMLVCLRGSRLKCTEL